MKWGIVSPRGRHFQKKMKYAFRERECLYASRTPGEVDLGDCGKVQSIAFNDLLRSDIDAVYICTPTKEHYELVCSAIEYGKHVLVEKTPAQTVVGLEKAIEFAKRQGVQLDIYFQPYEQLAGYGRTWSGEALFHLPLEGVHENPIFDVAFYPVMTAGYLSSDISNWEFGKAGTIFYCRLSNDWHLEFSINEVFEQSHKYSSDFRDEMYAEPIVRFERNDRIQFERPIEVYKKIMPILLDWRDYYANETART